MFRPPPTIVELGKPEDMRQLEAALRERMPGENTQSPIREQGQRQAFQSPSPNPSNGSNLFTSPPAGSTGSVRSPTWLE